MARTLDMTKGNPMRLIVQFALPILAGGILQQLYSLVDTIVVGRVEGVTALAALSASGWLDWLVLGIGMGIAQGFAIEIAQAFGAGDTARLHRSEGQGILLTASLFVVLEITAQLLVHPALVLLRHPENTIQLTELYLRIIYGGMPLMLGYNLLSGYLRSVGDSKTPMLAVIIASVSNIILDILLVGVWHFGIAGAAAATIIAIGFSFLICLAATCRTEILFFQRKDLVPDKCVCIRLMKLGLPIAMQNTIIALGGLVLQSVINGFGFIFMAGINAASRLQGLLELAATSLGAAVSTYAGQNIGAGLLDRVKTGLRKSAIIAAVLSILIAAMIIPLEKPILRFFVDDTPEIVEQVIAYGARYLTVLCAGLWALYLLYVYRSTLQGIGDTVIPMLSGVIELIMRVGCSLLLPVLIGEYGVYLAEIAAWIGAAAWLMAGYYRDIHRLEKRIVSGKSSR